MSYENAPASVGSYSNQGINEQAQKQWAGAGGIAAEASGINAVEQRMAEAIKALEILVGTLEDAEQRLNGSRPEKNSVSASTPRPVPNGKVALLSAAMEEMQIRISRAQQAAMMISRTL